MLITARRFSRGPFCGEQSSASRTQDLFVTVNGIFTVMYRSSPFLTPFMDASTRSKIEARWNIYDKLIVQGKSSTFAET
jgi:hypothetical protein